MSKKLSLILVIIFHFTFSIIGNASSKPNDLCLITRAGSKCAGEQIKYTIGCSVQSPTWSIDETKGDILGHNDLSFVIVVWNTPGNHTVSVDDPQTDQWATLTDNISGFNVDIAPELTSNVNCNTHEVTLSVTNVDPNNNYVWYDPYSQIAGNGTTLVLNDFDGIATYSCHAYNGTTTGECYSESSISISHHQGAGYSYDAINSDNTKYRRSYIFGKYTAMGSAGLNHYWQDNSTDKLIDPNRKVIRIQDVGDGTGTLINEPGTYYIRGYDTNSNCWTDASVGYSISVNKTPPIPSSVNVTQSIGYSDVSMTVPLTSHTLEYATYYWVNSASANAKQITKPFNSNTRITESGTYYLRGRDADGSTWGPTLTVEIEVIPDPITRVTFSGKLELCGIQPEVYSIYPNGQVEIENINWTTNDPDAVILFKHTNDPEIPPFSPTIIWGNDGSHKVFAEITFTDNMYGGGLTRSLEYDVNILPNPPSEIEYEYEMDCETLDVTLRVVNPDNAYSYEWFNGPLLSEEFLGTGQTLNTVLGSSIFYKVRASSGEDCFSEENFTIYFPSSSDYEINTEYLHTMYRDSRVFGTGVNLEKLEMAHYLQLSEDGKVIDENLRIVETPDDEIDGISYETAAKVHQGNKYWVRGYNSETGCWTPASHLGVYIDVNSFPTKPVISETQGFDFVTVEMINGNLDLLNEYAEYFLVSSPTSTDPIEPFVNPMKFYESGTYFLRGRDKETLNWGTAYQIDINLNFDSNLNWIQNKAFDGTGQNNIIAESKSFFDDAGKMLQTQTKNLTENQVLASQSIRDKYDREVITTLPAPINAGIFRYKSAFVRGTDNVKYDQDDVEDNAPLGDTGKGTLGWYYSENNNMESNVPISAYPYSKVEFYDDGTGDIKRSAGVGEELKMGSGREVYTRSFGVTDELDEYMAVRNFVLNNTAGPTTLEGEAVQHISIDQNGKKSVSFTDRNENVLVAGLLQTAATDLALKPIYNAENDVVTPSYNIYDNTGRLVVSIAPNGMKEILEGYRLHNDFTGFDKDNLPFATYYTYNYQGWLLKTREPDAGISEYMYRTDGSIRFSQNSEQAKNGRFSYTDYDALGRPIESGEYTGTLVFKDDLYGQLENIGNNTWTTEKSDWVKTSYDVPYGTIPNLPAEDYSQDFVTGAVSYTENENITTWYSYDEQGRVTWMAQNPKLLTNRVFVVEYEYDLVGNVKKVGYKSFENGNSNPVDKFFHYYIYDADSRLSQTYTSLKENIAYSNLPTHPDAMIQASYEYYLHGPLKRIVLGDDIQGIDFVYNIQGWLKQINNPDDPSDATGREDAFSLLLNYYKTNKANLFSPITISSNLNINNFHGLPSKFQQPQVEIADIMELYRPFVPVMEVTQPLKDQSAEKALEQTIEGASNKEELTNGVG